MTNLKSQTLILQAPDAISIAREAIRPLNATLKPMEEMTLTILKVL